MHKILILFSSCEAKGGIPRFNKNILDAAEETNFHYHVIVQNDTGEENIEGNYSKIKITSCSGNKIVYLWSILIHLMINNYHKIFIGHLNSVPLIILKYITLINFFTPTVLFAHGIEVWGRMKGIKKICAKKITQFLAVSEYTRQSIVEQLGFEFSDKAIVFPNTIPKSWYEEEQNAFSGDIPDDFPKKFILTVSRLDKTERPKGIDTLIKALKNIDEHYALLVVGKGNDIEYLKDIAKAENVEGRVFFKTFVEDALLRSLYNRACCFALPSDKEGFGIVYLEAMFYGAAAIGANSKGVPDVIQNDINGLLVEYGQVNDLVLAIDKVVSNKVFRNQLIENGLNSVAKNGVHSFQSFAERFRQALDD